MTENNQQVTEVDNTATEAKPDPGAVRRSTTAGILKAASAATGMEFESVESMMAALARLSATTANAPAPAAPEAKPQRSTDLEDQFRSLKQDLAKKEQALRERELEGDIRSAMGDRFDSDLVDYALSKVKSSIQWEDGAYQIVNNRGQIRYTESGEPMTINDLVNEVAKTNPKLLKMGQAAIGGSGLKNRSGMFGADVEAMPDYVTDPAGFNAWAVRNGLGRGIGLKGVKASVSVSQGSKKII